MNNQEITSPFPLFTDRAGKPVDNGYVYIGKPGYSPLSKDAQISIYWDSNFTIPAAQPLRTLSGYASREGTPSRAYVNQNYSILITDKYGALIFSSMNESPDYQELKYFVRNYGDGTQTAATFQAMIDQLGTVNNYSAYFDAGTWTFPEDFEAPANISIVPDPGTRFQIASSKTLDLRSRFEGQDFTYFTGDGVIDFTNNTHQNELRLIWWANPDIVDCTVGAQKCFDQGVATKIPIKGLYATFKVTSLYIEDSFDFKYDGNGATITGVSTGSDVEVIRLGRAPVSPSIDGTNPARRAIFTNAKISVASGSTYSRILSCYFATDCDLHIDLFQEDDTDQMTAFFIDFSWNNRFKGRCEAYHLWEIGTNNCNNNCFFNPRFRGTDQANSIGVYARGFSNGVYNADISNIKHSVALGGSVNFQLYNLYAEGVGTSVIGIGAIAGNAKMPIFQGIYTPDNKPITTYTGTAGHYSGKVNVNAFNHTSGSLFANSLAIQNWEYEVFSTNGGAQLFSTGDASTLISGKVNSYDTTGDLVIYDTREQHFQGRQWVNLTNSQYVNVGALSGTVDLIDISELRDAAVPFITYGRLIGRDGSTATRYLEFWALVNADGTLKAHSLIEDHNSGATAIQITGTILQVTTLNSSNWNLTLTTDDWQD